LSRRIALVTGAARGIGRAIALELAEQGRNVAVADILATEAKSVAAEVERAGARTLAVTLDVTDATSVAATLERVSDALGPVEVLVNNAGWDELRPFVETDGVLGSGDRDQLQGLPAAHAGRAARHGRARLGADRQHRLRCRPGRFLRGVRLRRSEGSSDRVYKDDRARVGAGG
jgi:hypothetical protein